MDTNGQLTMEASDTLQTTVNTLCGALEDAGACWGEDNIGQAFINGDGSKPGWGQSRDEVLDALDQMVNTLRGTGANMVLAGKTFAAAEQANTIGAPAGGGGNGSSGFPYFPGMGMGGFGGQSGGREGRTRESWVPEGRELWDAEHRHDHGLGADGMIGGDAGRGDPAAFGGRRGGSGRPRHERRDDGAGERGFEGNGHHQGNHAELDHEAIREGWDRYQEWLRQNYT